jgi:CRP/FNR family transcriptional regulator, cyclic AMP receptor protein
VPVPGIELIVNDALTGRGRRGFQELLGDQRWQALLSVGTLRSYRPGSFLLRQGDEGGFLLALTSGRVKVLARDEDGAEVLLALRGPGDLVGEMTRRSTAKRTATVQAIDRSTARYLPTVLFDHFLSGHHAHGAFSDYLIAKLSETVPYQVQMVHFTPRQRIARLLLEVVALASPDQPDPLRVPFSQEALAGALGLARSTVAGRITELRRAGVLAAGPRLVVADLRALARHAGVALRAD